MSALLPVAPLLLLVVAGLAIMLVDAFAKERPELGIVTSTALLVACAISFVGLLSTVGADAAAPAASTLPEYITRYISVDRYGQFFDVVICAGAALAVLLAGGYLREHGLERGEFYVLVLFSALGGMVLARSIDMLTLFVGLETMSLGVYSLIAYRRTSARATEGAVKYFLLGSFAAAIMLFGIALIYGATGHTDFAGIAESIRGGEFNSTLMLLGLAMLVSGLAFKVSAVPFHMWAPDAYEGAATPVTTFMAVAVKSAAFAVFLRVLVVAFGDEMSTSHAGWPALIVGLAVVTMVYGNLAALSQTSVKRMLAYSSIAHAGYILVGLAASATVDTAKSGVLFYLLAYTVSNALTFGALIWAGSRGKEATSYDDLAGLGRRHPVVGFAFILGVLSLMGFPPTAGFFGKWYVFSAAVEADLTWLAIVGVLSSAIGAFYYLKVIVYLFMREPAEGAPIAVPMKSGYVAIALILAGYFVVKMGVTPGTYLDMAIAAASGI